MVRWLMRGDPDAGAVRQKLGLQSCDSNCDMRDGLIELLSQWHTRFPYDLRPYLAAGRPARDINLISFSMLNPADSLELVHAVPIPARAPLFSQALPQLAKQSAMRLPATASEIATRFEVDRKARGATVAEFRGDIEMHRASTERVDCFAEWNDISDEIGTRWVQSPKQHPMFHVDNLVGVLESAPTLGHGMVPVGVDQEEQTVFGPASTLDLAPDNDLLMLDPTRPAIGRMRNQDFGTTVPHFDFGDAKARLVTFHLRAASRYARDFSERTGTSRDSEVLESRWLNATLPPSKPQVAFVVPLFEKDSSEIGSMVRRRRHGGWFRIWLDRPWYSSGAGELLALVCWPQELFRARGGSGGYLTDKARRAWGSLWDEAKFPPGDRPSAALERLYTGWGLDPIWDQPHARLTYIPPGAFANRLQPDVHARVAPSQLLGPDEAPSDGNSVALALYRPDYDIKEGRWYADVRITPPDDAYFPFVRLGLARYQPNAIRGCELSEIVTSEFVQLTPDRSCHRYRRTPIER